VTFTTFTKYQKIYQLLQFWSAPERFFPGKKNLGIFCQKRFDQNFWHSWDFPKY